MAKSSTIALHQNELDPVGVNLEPIQALVKYSTPHRDDHYMFILQQKGQFQLEIDFNEMKLKDAVVCFVAPGQVHRYVKWKDSKGWFVFVDVSLAGDQVREIFETYQHVRQVVPLHKDDVIFRCIPILAQLLNREQGSLKASIIADQVGALLGMIASKLVQLGKSEYTVNGQRYHIANRFKQLVRNNYKAHKQVQQYAELLTISPLYLNEVVKEITGFPASYWIQQEIMLEAKRLLFYTALDVKQIAYELGYEDHAYFSRFFKKNTGITALEFRSKNHGLSNHPL